MHHTTRAYFVPVGAGTLFSLLALVLIVWFVNPFAAGAIAHTFFYISLFLSAVGIFTLIGVQLRKRLLPGILVEQLRVSFRQAFLIGIIITGLILLQANDLLFWWVGLTLILFITSIEVLFNT